MKNVHFLYLITLLIIITNVVINACPTCIGRLERTTPPFFSKEYEEYCQGCHMYGKKREQTPQPNHVAAVEEDYDTDL